MSLTLGLGALLAMAGISAASGLVSSAADQAHAVASREDTQAFNAQEAATARAFSAEEAQKQRDFEKIMSDSSYQRQRADLEAAGYNPASIGMTQGASTPSGAMASPSMASASNAYFHSMNFGSYFSNLMSSAVQYSMAKDKNFTNKVIAEMYTSNADSMNKLTNATRKALNSTLKMKHTWYDSDGSLWTDERSDLI